MHLRLLACLLSAAALAGAPGMAARAEPIAIKTYVWRVEAPRQPGRRPAPPDRLLGTMHVPIGGRGLPKQVEGWIKASDRFVMETNLATADPGLVEKYGALEPGQDLKALLPPAAWPKLVKQAAPLGVAEDALRRLDPWYVALAFLPTSADASAVMDSRLRALAEDARVPIAYLESAEDQMRALDGVAMKEDLAQLLELVDDPKRPAAELAELRRAYERGDLGAVERYLFDAERLAAYPDFYQKVFYQRNQTWLPAIERTMRKETAFVAVGLGHLLGDRGLLAMLAKRGWKVTRETL